MSKIVATLIAGLFATSAFAQTATHTTAPVAKAEAKQAKEVAKADAKVEKANAEAKSDVAEANEIFIFLSKSGNPCIWTTAFFAASTDSKIIQA